MTFKIILSGFETKEQARHFLDWYEGQGEQDEGIGEQLGNGVTAVHCDVRVGMIEHPDGWEYKVNIYKEENDE